MSTATIHKHVFRSLFSSCGDALCRQSWLIIKRSDSPSLTWGKRNKKKTTPNVTVTTTLTVSPGRQQCQKAVVFLLVQDRVGLNAVRMVLDGSTPLLFQDFHRTRRGQCPLWRRSQSPSSSSLLGLFIVRERHSLEANCTFAWIVDIVLNHLQMGLG